MICEISISDPFGQSHLIFYPSSDFEAIPLYLAAGQDGQQVFWLAWNGSNLNVSSEPELLETIPMFAPSNDWYVAMESCGITRYHYPTGEPLRYRNQFWSDEQGMGWLECLDDRRALASTGEGIIYLLDAISLRIIAEVIVAGHEPRPAEELYPTLGPNKDLCTHIDWFIRIGSTVVMTECSNHEGTSADWQDRVIVLSVDDLQR